MVLVFVEEPGDLTQQALAFARTLGEPLDAFCIGEEMSVHGVETLHVAEGDAYSAYAPGAIAQALVELATGWLPRRSSPQAPSGATRCSLAWPRSSTSRSRRTASTRLRVIPRW